MKRFLSILSLVILGFVSQSCYDDSALWESVNDLDSRVKTLETLCKEMNTNLASLQTLVSAMKQGDYIVDVAPLTENGVEVGYQITFYDRGTVNIYHGKDGVGSGNVPDFGAKQDTDGVYYWTVNGEWILDDKGNKLPVSSAEGTAGVTPKLKVENGKWYVSYDEGKTWEEVGSAVSDGSNGCLFKDVQLTDSALVLTMSDGSVFTLPIGERFRIVLGEFDASTIQYGTDVVIPYTIEGAKGEVSVFVVSDGWMFETELVEETSLSGKLIIRQEDYDDEEISGKVAVFAVAEDGTTVSKVIRLLSGVLRPSSDRYNDVFTVESSASRLEFTVATNRDFEVNTNADWITYADTKAVEEKTLVFDIQENENGRRKTYVEIASGDIDFGFTVAQKGFSDAFSITVSCDEVRGGDWTVNIDTLFNKAGQTIHEVLGYSSWEEVAAAAGDWNAVYNRAGEVILTAYDLYTGEAMYDQQCSNGLGFRHDSDGYLVSDWSLCKTAWNWYTIWDGSKEVLGNTFGFNTSNQYAGETNSFGILFTAPEGEARIEVTVNVTEYVDPEKGLYDTPAAPGRYEFTLHDKADPDSLLRVNSMFVSNYEIAEILKSTLGMTTYEISRVADQMDREYQLNNGERRDGHSDIFLDAKGYVTDWNRDTMVGVFSWIFGALPESLYVNVYLPTEWNIGGLIFWPAIYRAAGKTVSYRYVIRYEGYELIFTHEIEFVGDPYEISCLVGKDGQKVWRYAPDQTYGNAGNSGNGFGYENGNVDGMWWGAAPSDLISQLAHAGGVAYGDESPNAYMIFTDEGVVTTYTPLGESVRSGMYEVNDYDPSRPSGWEIGKLKTSEPALLFPWSINEGGVGVTEYDIMYLTPDQMTLVYTNDESAGDWGEITFWRFVTGYKPSDIVWGLVGTHNLWNAPDIHMEEVDGMYVAYNVVFDQEVNEFQIRGNEVWDETAHYGLSVPGAVEPDHYYSLVCGGSPGTVTIPKGTYDIWFDIAGSKLYVMTPGKSVTEAQEGMADVPQPDYTWYLVGDFNGWNTGDEAYRMTKDGDWHVYYGFTTSGAELKFNAGDWSVNKGADYFAADQAVFLVQDGSNINVPAGTYDIYLNADASEAYFMTVDSEDNGPANKIWSKEVTSYAGYDASQKVRLAKYGDNILLANTTKVYVIDPATGEAVNTIAMPKGVTAHSVLVDDAGNFMIAADAAYGATTNLYLVPDPTNPVPEELLSFDTKNYYCVEAGNFRVKGNVKDDAVVTLTVADGGSGAVIFWEIVDGEFTQFTFEWGSRSWDYVTGPYSGWAVATTCAAPAGTSLADGLFFVGYSGDYNLKYKAAEADWVTSYVTGSSWMENYNCISTAEWKGNNYAAIVMGCHFNYDMADAVLLDVNDPAAAKHLYTHYGDGDATWDWDAGVNNSWTGLGTFSDVLLVPTEEDLLMVYVDSNYGTIGCVAIRE